MKVAHWHPFSPFIGNTSERDANVLKHKTNTSSSISVNSSIGNIVTTACANSASEEEEEQARWLHFCNDEQSEEPLERDLDLPEPKPLVLPTTSAATAEISLGGRLQDKEEFGVRAAVTQVTPLHQANHSNKQASSSKLSHIYASVFTCSAPKQVKLII